MLLAHSSLIRCRKCGADKDRSEFRESALRRYRYYCRKCQNQISIRSRKSGAYWKHSRGLMRAVARARKRADKAGVPCTITMSEVNRLWREQGGKCAVSGLDLLPVGGQAGEVHPLSPSLDRFTPALGYVAGNVRWVAFAVNCFKGSGTDADVLRMAKAIVRMSQTRQRN